MALTDSDHDLLVRWLDGELDPYQRAAVEERLQREPALKQGLDDLELAIKALRFNALQQQVKQARTQLESGAKSEAPVRRMPWLRYAFSAAAVIMLVWIGSRLFQPVASPEQLYAEHFMEYAPAQSRGTNDTANDYAAGRYAKVIARAEVAEKRPDIFSLPQDAYLSAALAAMHLQDWNKALHFLGQLRQPDFEADADYYKALVFLRLKRFKEARLLLEKIHDNPDHMYHKQVDEKFLASVRKLDAG